MGESTRSTRIPDIAANTFLQGLVIPTTANAIANEAVNRARISTQRQRIHPLDHVEEVGGVAGFVGLQVSDEVPFQMAWALRDFDFRFLDPVFAKQGKTRRRCFRHPGRRLVLADRHQAHGFRWPARTGAGLFNTALDAGEVFLNVRHG